MKNFKSFRFISCILAALVILFTGTASAHTTAQKASAAVPVSQNTAPENALLQFSAGGHVLGFKPDKVYFASFDHAIVEEFVGTKGVMPVGEAGKVKAEDTKGAPALGKVVYKNLWQGITLKYEANNGGIAESTYVLEPDADVKKIKLKYNVAVDIQKDGTLRFRHPSEKGYFSQSAPKAWQEIDGKKTHVDIAFADYGDNTIGFRLGEYNRKYPVVIDPTYQWHTFYGSAGGNDYGYGIATDTSGNVYVTGYSAATWNGPGATAPLNAYSGGYDIVVLKLNTAGAYQWHTFYGAVVGTDYGYSITVDTSGNVYVSGRSGATWNGPGATAPLNAYTGGNNIVVLKLNSAGAYQWHTFYGSATGDIGYAIATDTSGNVYVTGHSAATWNGPGATAPLNAYTGGATYNIAVLKLNTNGVYQWHTFYGAAAATTNIGYGIATDTSGNVYVIGYSTATWNAGATAPLNAYSGGNDIVALKLNSAGAYQWHTFYGSAGGADYGRAIATDTSGNVYVTGYSAATWNAGATTPLNAKSGGDDIVVLKLGADTYTVTYNGNGNTGGSVPVDGSSPYLSGATVTVLGNTGTLVKTGYTFAGWNTAADGSGSAYAAAATFAIAANTTLYAQWTLNTYTVTTAATNGTITSTNNPTVNYGSTTTVTGSANANYYFTGVSGCSGTTQNNTDQTITTFSYTTGEITGACTVAATFAIKTYTVTTTATNGTITSTINPTVNHGSTTTVTGSATTGYYFTGVSGCSGTTQSNTDQTITTFSYTTGAITGACTVAATFTLNNSMTLPAASGSGNITLATDTAGCGFYEVEVKTEAQVADDPSYDYPNGLVKFKLNCTTADVRITFTNATDLSGSTYRKYGPTTPGDANTTQWYTFNNVTISGNTVTLHLQDGQLGDDTGVDGVIVDAGGPGTTLQETTPYSVPSMSEWGMIIIMLLEGLGSMYFMRKRKTV